MADPHKSRKILCFIIGMLSALMLIAMVLIPSLNFRGFDGYIVTFLSLAIFGFGTFLFGCISVGLASSIKSEKTMTWYSAPAQISLTLILLLILYFLVGTTLSKFI